MQQSMSEEVLVLTFSLVRHPGEVYTFQTNVVGDGLSPIFMTRKGRRTDPEECASFRDDAVHDVSMETMLLRSWLDEMFAYQRQPLS